MLPELITRYESWLVLGFVLIAADMLLGFEFFALSFGVSALLTGALLALLASVDVPLGWQLILIIFAIDGLAVLVPLRKWLNKKQAEGGKDINDY